MSIKWKCDVTYHIFNARLMVIGTSHVLRNISENPLEYVSLEIFACITFASSGAEVLQLLRVVQANRFRSGPGESSTVLDSRSDCLQCSFWRINK